MYITISSKQSPNRVFRWRYVFLLAIMLLIGGRVLYIQQQPTVYRSTVELSCQYPPPPPGNISGLFIDCRSVLSRHLHRWSTQPKNKRSLVLGLGSPIDIDYELQIKTSRHSKIIVIVDARDPRAAQTIAEALVDFGLSDLAHRLHPPYKQEQILLNAELIDIRRVIRQVSSNLSSHTILFPTENEELRRIHVQLSTLQAQMEELQRRYDDVVTELDNSYVTTRETFNIVQPATYPDRPLAFWNRF